VGGKLDSYTEAQALLQVVARRDQTEAIAHGGSLLGAVAVWLSGRPEQQQRLADLIARGGQVSLALTEREHGSDLLASEVEATRTAAGYRLSGEKWPIGNAGRSEAVTVLARTSHDRGPRDLSLFLVELERLKPGSYHRLPKVKTHGIRGANLSGIQFNACELPPSALVGPPGAGLEIVLKGLQITRTLVAGLSLGAADTALRTTLRFALQRRLYGGPIFELPLTRATLVEAFVDLLVCHCLTVAASRALHLAPGQQSLWSSVVKYFVPTTVDSLLQRLAVVLGARSYLREEHQSGIFQKIVRDHAVIALFDGSTVVNLQVIASQLRTLRRRSTRPDGLATSESDGPGAIFDLSVGLPAPSWSGLELICRQSDGLLKDLERWPERIAQLETEPGPAADVRAGLARLAHRLAAEVDRLDARLETLGAPAASAYNRGPEHFGLARTYSRLFAATACLNFWYVNRRTLEPFVAAGDWLVLALDRLLAEGDCPDPAAPRRVETVGCELTRRLQSGAPFSPLPDLAAAPTAGLE
jgi:alkylation response protein AidB-like acyl-CoA dehydrogenase